jgi:hypothetical protein
LRSLGSVRDEGGNVLIYSEKTDAQQGLAATCKDLIARGTTKGGRRAAVWRMSPYERRRRGNAL